MSQRREGELKLVRIHTALGQLRAQVVKTKLESAGIPVLLRYDSASIVFGITVNGLGKVQVMVPEELAQEARDLLSEAT